ncbi:alpha/beta fold hydrolase [Streptomyces flavofungini]|uniref:alpha/beta fold hydrolase n=1 Tax=Streptomyces flavofungini TaxID=68200 RepID=UPI0025B12D9E|nr:alpha/beta fold hydrolase [Streptomyces flavofungini]WJV50208.1 alpha/beta fold hydrolase [Streptomyces flavofungini]
MTRTRAAVRRTSAVGLALAACVTAAPALASATTTPAAARGGATPAPGPGLDRFYDQRLDWRGCVLGPDDETGRALAKAGARCADVTVPVDYSDPGGRTMTVAISRIKATDTRHRVGPLLLNGGGPGGPSIGDAPDIHRAMKDVAARYDIIGVDPRFVGRSDPLDCGWPVSSAVFSAGTGRAGFDRQVALHKDLAARCRATNKSVLPFVTTRDTARDMDVIRGALGERKISYLGYSYGTYLGTVYTQMFPGRHDRVVLDGAIDPRRYQPRLLRGAEPENDRALSDWAAWAARRHDTYGLGRTRAQVLAAVDRTVEASARGLTVGTAPDTFRLDDTTVPTLLVMGIADDTDEARAAFGEQVSVLVKAAQGQPTRLSPEFTAALRSYVTGKDSHYGSVQTAILCGDSAAPRDPERYWRDIERSRAAHPVMGPLTNNITPCAFWDRPREEPTQVRRDAPALLVGATGDPRATYEGTVGLRDLLPSSRLITLKGANRHGIYGFYGNACVDANVNTYLATGKLPGKDLTCVRQHG